MTLRFHPKQGTGDVPPAVAAKLMGLTLQAFTEMLNRPGDGFLARGFPGPDPTSGNFDLDAINEWRRARYPQAYGLTAIPSARDARTVVGARLARYRGG